MRKRLFWIAVGTVVGIVVAAKARSYVKAHSPAPVRRAAAGSHGAVEAVRNLYDDFQQARHTREEELNRQFAERFR